MNKRPEITEKTREKITSAFWEIYRSRDIMDIRIGEVTDLAGYHRSTFYEYFADIYDLLEQEEHSLIEKLQESRDTGGEEQQKVFNDIIRFFMQNGEKISILIERDRTSFLRQLKDIIYPEFLSENNLQDNARSLLVYEFVSNGILMSVDYWYNNQSQISLQELISVLEDIAPAYGGNGDIISG